LRLLQTCDLTCLCSH